MEWCYAELARQRVRLRDQFIKDYMAKGFDYREAILVFEEEWKKGTFDGEIWVLTGLPIYCGKILPE